MKTSAIAKIKRILLVGVQGLAVLFFTAGGQAAVPPMIVGMGDSISEGVQADDAAWQTQVFSYVNWISFQGGGDLTIPYILTNGQGATQDTENRSRIFPMDINTNVSVAGADVDDLLNDASDAATVAEMDDEVDLVMFPRQTTQMQYVESVTPEVIICWIGNNDVLAAATSFDSLDASQLTPLVDFDAAYVEIANRLQALITNNGSKVVLANIPNVADIGFLVDRSTAESITGFPVALPDGHLTSTIAAILMKLQGNDDLMMDPSFVLDDVEKALIVDRIADFNDVIQREADRIGVPVVDINTRFSEIVANPPMFFGRPLTKMMLGGVFSHDGVHPSNVGQGIVANEFIKVLNQAHGTNVPELSQQVLNLLYLTDPNIDKDQDGKATGRLGVGLIESLFFLLGFTGDTNDFIPN